MAAVRDDFQFHKIVGFLSGQLGELPSQSGYPDGLFSGGATRCVGQHPDPSPVNRLH